MADLAVEGDLGLDLATKGGEAGIRVAEISLFLLPHFFLFFCLSLFLYKIVHREDIFISKDILDIQPLTAYNWHTHAPRNTNIDIGVLFSTLSTSNLFWHFKQLFSHWKQFSQKNITKAYFIELPDRNN